MDIKPNQKYIDEARKLEAIWMNNPLFVEMLKRCPPGKVLLESDRLVPEEPETKTPSDT